MDVEKSGGNRTLRIWVHAFLWPWSPLAIDAAEMDGDILQGFGFWEREGRNRQQPHTWKLIHAGEAERTTPELIQGPDRSYACVILISSQVPVIVDQLCLVFWLLDLFCDGCVASNILVVQHVFAILDDVDIGSIARFTLLSRCGWWRMWWKEEKLTKCIEHLGTILFQVTLAF